MLLEKHYHHHAYNVILLMVIFHQISIYLHVSYLYQNVKHTHKMIHVKYVRLDFYYQMEDATRVMLLKISFYQMEFVYVNQLLEYLIQILHHVYQQLQIVLHMKRISV